MLKRGDKGKEVREMASGLCALDYLSADCVDDEFDFNKQESVRLFQADAGLVETGIFDDETRRALNKRLAQRG